MVSIVLIILIVRNNIPRSTYSRLRCGRRDLPAPRVLLMGSSPTEVHNKCSSSVKREEMLFLKLCMPDTKIAEEEK